MPEYASYDALRAAAHEKARQTSDGQGPMAMAEAVNAALDLVIPVLAKEIEERNIQVVLARNPGIDEARVRASRPAEVLDATPASARGGLSDEDPEFELVMPFVGVASKGGPYDDNAYVAGYEAGMIDARLQYQQPELLSLTVHSENLAQIDLIAMHRGYTVKEGPADDDWAAVDLTRAGTGVT